MNALQEIVKKVASLPADTCAAPSASEASPCSPWILNEINGYVKLELKYTIHTLSRSLSNERVRKVSKFLSFSCLFL